MRSALGGQRRAMPRAAGRVTVLLVLLTAEFAPMLISVVVHVVVQLPKNCESDELLCLLFRIVQ